MTAMKTSLVSSTKYSWCKTIKDSIRCGRFDGLDELRTLEKKLPLTIPSLNCSINLGNRQISVTEYYRLMQLTNYQSFLQDKSRLPRIFTLTDFVPEVRELFPGVKELTGKYYHYEIVGGKLLQFRSNDYFRSLNRLAYLFGAFAFNCKQFRFLLSCIIVGGMDNFRNVVRLYSLPNTNYSTNAIVRYTFAKFASNIRSRVSRLAMQ